MKTSNIFATTMKLPANVRAHSFPATGRSKGGDGHNQSTSGGMTAKGQARLIADRPSVTRPPKTSAKRLGLTLVDSSQPGSNRSSVLVSRESRRAGRQDRELCEDDRKQGFQVTAIWQGVPDGLARGPFAEPGSPRSPRIDSPRLPA